MEVYSSTSLSLVSKFTKMLDESEECDEASLKDTYESLISAVRIWRKCLEEFIQENRSSQVKQLAELSEKSNSRLVVVKDYESSIKMRYKLYLGASDGDSTSSQKHSVSKH